MVETHIPECQKALHLGLTGTVALALATGEEQWLSLNLLKQLKGNMKNHMDFRRIHATSNVKKYGENIFHDEL